MTRGGYLPNLRADEIDAILSSEVIGRVRANPSNILCARILARSCNDQQLRDDDHVVEVLIANGMRPDHLGAGGMAEVRRLAGLIAPAHRTADRLELRALQHAVISIAILLFATLSALLLAQPSAFARDPSFVICSTETARIILLVAMAIAGSAVVWATIILRPRRERRGDTQGDPM